MAERALGGYVQPAVGDATHYHANYVVPYWRPTVLKVAQIGAHIFYRWNGELGRPTAFTAARSFSSVVRNDLHQKARSAALSMSITRGSLPRKLLSAGFCVFFSSAIAIRRNPVVGYGILA